MYLYTYVASLYSCIYVGILFANRYKHVYAYQDGGSLSAPPPSTPELTFRHRDFDFLTPRHKRNQFSLTLFLHCLFLYLATESDHFYFHRLGDEDVLHTYLRNNLRMYYCFFGVA